jgi:type I restriction-modification system DNA methylase subunit
MDNRSLLQSLTKKFTRPELIAFLRNACGSFRPQSDDLSYLLKEDDLVEDLVKLGEIDFDEGGRRLILLASQSQRGLTTQSGKLKQYEIAKNVLKSLHYDAGIFVFHDADGNFRFSLITAHYKGTRREFNNFRRYTYFISPDLPAHTFISQIGKADFSSIESLLEAFSVEPVTKEFYREYEKIFREAEASITLDWSDEQKRLYTQRFFNRLMFLAFLERKGWMKFSAAGEGIPPQNYLQALFSDYVLDDENKSTANFHRSRLNTLFFWGLNNPRGDERNDPRYQEVQRKIGDVPYLNGGLFVEEYDDQSWFFPDQIVANILTDLIYHFNFTVTESTPLDVEVAVDPEMLGKIFEELVTGRHESGSYYTPKPVVAFMCREALKGYLATELPGESEEALSHFVDENNPDDLSDPEGILKALRKVKVCDPACGSGAYLLGMLHQLLELRQSLFAKHSRDMQLVYDRKLEIIQNNLYGVDKDVFAVNIARLRLWLSLIVDFEGDSPPPLPNLDFKIETGDGLTAPDPSGGLDLGFRRQLVDDFLLAKNKFTTAHHQDKAELWQQTQELRDEIITWSGHDKDFDGFDWTIDFAEVFIAPSSDATLTGAMSGLVNTTQGQMELTAASPGEMGFNIILANPPYVRADAQFKHIENEEERQKAIAEWQAYRTRLKSSKIYKTLYEKWDLYIAFLERAFQLLRPNGQMVFIVPDAYNAAKYTKKSHEFFLRSSCVKRIDFCSDIDLFDAGVSNTILRFEKSIPADNHQPVRVKRWGNRDDFNTNIEVLASCVQLKYGLSLFKLSGRIVSTLSDGLKLLEEICYISKGMVIHADERKVHLAFKTADLISSSKDKIHSRLFVEGKDLTRWYPKRVRYLEWGTERAPNHFSRKTFPELQNCLGKLISVRTPGSEPKTIYDYDGIHFDASSVGFVKWDALKGVINRSISKTAKYLHQDPLGDRAEREKISSQFDLKYVLAIMNSSFARDWLKSKRRSKMHVYPDDWKQLPIVPISLEEQMEYVHLVNKILAEYDKHGYPLPDESDKKVTAWEEELDEMVNGLLYQ